MSLLPIDCKGHRFVFRDKINTYEFYGTNYCWKNEGGSLKLRRCNTIIGSVFIEGKEMQAV